MILQNPEHIIEIIKCCKQTYNIPGDVAEVGVYEGGSAEIIINNINQSKKIFLCDTFSGLLDCENIDTKNSHIKNGLYKSSIDSIGLKFYENKNVHIVPGLFPESATKNMIENYYSLVHIDVDTYLSTINCLQFFYPKINFGGQIIVHDYAILDGVTKAIHHFLDSGVVEECLIGSMHNQIKFVKIK